MSVEGPHKNVWRMCVCVQMLCYISDYSQNKISFWKQDFQHNKVKATYPFVSLSTYTIYRFKPWEERQCTFSFWAKKHLLNVMENVETYGKWEIIEIREWREQKEETFREKEEQKGIYKRGGGMSGAEKAAKWMLWNMRWATGRWERTRIKSRRHEKSAVPYD